MAVKKDWGANILCIETYSHRSMKIKMQTGIKNKIVHIINIYAPHMGYIRKERDTYWGQIKQILTEIPKK